MKLKYYMRGLGIGIILTTLILSIGNTKEKLTDKEIMERAAELGMVTQEESDSQLDQVLADIKPTRTQAQPSVTTKPSDEPSVTPEPTITPTAVPTQEPTVIPTQVPTAEPVPTAKPADNQASVKEISFTIKKGMSSDQVAKLLAEVGLIKDTEDFNQYIIDKGKASIIRVGTFSLPQDATYEDIVKKITTK